MQKSLVLSATAHKKIVEHAEAYYPKECCGFMFGIEGDVRNVTLVRPTRNVKKGDQRRRFEINPLAYVKAEQYALAHDLKLLGVYHSHPNHPAIASEHDLEVALPYFSYVIVSVMYGIAKEIWSWKLHGHQKEFYQEETLLTQEQYL